MNFDWVTQRIYHKKCSSKNYCHGTDFDKKKHMGPHLRHILRNKERTIEIRSSEESN